MAERARLWSPKERVRRWLAPQSCPKEFPRVQATVDAVAILLGEANELLARRDVLAAVLTYREAFRQLAGARRIMQSADSDKPDDAQLASLFERPTDATTLLTFDATAEPSPDLLALAKSCAKAARKLDAFLACDLRYTARGMRFERLLLLLGAVLSLFLLGIGNVYGAHNVARGKPVTSTSATLGHPSVLTNGAVEYGTFGLLVTGAGQQEIVVDLLKSHRLDRARFYGRGEGAFNGGLPFHVGLSHDGASYHELGTCTIRVTQVDPCVVDLQRESARYLKVWGGSLVLTEIEILGR